MIATIVLSAGASSRMGRPKALCTLPTGETFLARILRVAEEAQTLPFLVVGPPHGQLIGEEAGRHLRPHLVQNPFPERGMLSSAQAALSSLPEEAEGALIWPVDIPLVKGSTLKLLLAHAAERLIIPAHQGKGGHPLFVPRCLFAEMRALDPALGLRQLRENHAHEIHWLEVDDPGTLRDFDTSTDI